MQSYTATAAVVQLIACIYFGNVGYNINFFRARLEVSWRERHHFHYHYRYAISSECSVKCPTDAIVPFESLSVLVVARVRNTYTDIKTVKQRNRHVCPRAA